MKRRGESDRMEYEAGHTPEVSVIIPVYNNEAYIGETLNSLKAQTFADFEALCIDDGSSDHSAEIIQNHEAADPRFHYIYQENAGAGPARNHGLRKARGKYISFLDGDDLYDPNFLKRMVEALERTQADVCICERENFNSGNGQIMFRGNRYQRFEENRLYPAKDLTDGYYDLMTVFCWDKMFRRSFLQSHPYEFQSLRHSNDVAFVCSTMAAAGTVCFVKECLVRYRKGTGVSTQDHVVKYPLCAIEAFDQARENVYLLHEGDAAWQKAIDQRCANAFFNTFKKTVNDDRACREVYDAFVNRYETAWKFREKPLSYFGTMDLRFKMWCYRRVSYEALRKAYLKMYRESGTKKRITDLILPYGELLISSLFPHSHPRG